jgi:hypothetical protein
VDAEQRAPASASPTSTTPERMDCRSDPGRIGNGSRS